LPGGGLWSWEERGVTKVSALTYSIEMIRVYVQFILLTRKLSTAGHVKNSFDLGLT